MDAKELKEKAIDWLEKNKLVIPNYTPKYSYDVDRDLINSASVLNYLNDSNYINQLVENINNDTQYDEQTKIERAASLFEKLSLLIIFFDTLVTKNYRKVHLKNYAHISLAKCFIRLIKSKNDNLFILVCNPGKENPFYSVGFSLTDKNELYDIKKNFTDVHFDIVSWSDNLSFNINSVNLKNVTIKDITLKDLNIEK